jgi:uncharacterized membrane protein (DUF485 family)
MSKNIPDRIKLILQFIVFSLGAWLPLLFIIGFVCMFLSINVQGSNMVWLIWGSLFVSIIIQVAIFIPRWKKLLEQENDGILPDMKDMRNITPRQMIFFVIGFPLLITSVVVFQLYSRLAGVLCFIPFLVLWVIETVYVKKRYKKINDADQNKG